MTSMSMRGSGDQIADLRSEIERLNAKIAAISPDRSKRTGLRRPLAAASVAVLAVGIIAGVAGASGSTTNVAFTPLTTPKTVVSNTAIATKKSTSPVVIGGTTTVPSNATTVELQVSAKGGASGTLDFYPAGNVGGGSGQTLTYPGANQVATGTIQENVGQGGALTIYNAGIGTATVTAKIIGYSTQVTAGDISPADGTAGQVLTNTGTGAAWADNGQAYSSNSGGFVVGLSTSAPTTIGTLVVPAGTYAVTSSAEVQTFGTTNVTAGCQLEAPDGATVQYQYATTDHDAVFAQTGVITTTGGTIKEACQGFTTGTQAGVNNIVAVKVGAATGATVFGRRTLSSTNTTSASGRSPLK